MSMVLGGRPGQLNYGLKSLGMRQITREFAKKDQEAAERHAALVKKAQDEAKLRDTNATTTIEAIKSKTQQVIDLENQASRNYQEMLKRPWTPDEVLIVLDEKHPQLSFFLRKMIADKKVVLQRNGIPRLSLFDDYQGCVKNNKIQFSVSYRLNNQDAADDLYSLMAGIRKNGGASAEFREVLNEYKAPSIEDIIDNKVTVDQALAAYRASLSIGANITNQLVGVLQAFYTYPSGVAFADLVIRATDGGLTPFDALAVVPFVPKVGRVAALGFKKSYLFTAQQFETLSRLKGELARHADDASKLGGKVHQAVNDSKKLLALYRSGFACFPAGTLIKTEYGPVPVERLRDGDRIQSRDENDPAAPLEWKRVTLGEPLKSEVVRVAVAGGVLETTLNHPFHSQVRGWVGASELRPGERVLTDEAEDAVVEGVERIGETRLVYPLTVDDHRTYFVTLAGWGFGVWVHNECVITRVGDKYHISNGKDLLHVADSMDAAEAWAKAKPHNFHTPGKAGTGPRLGPRRISDALYDELRSQTPTPAIRDAVNLGKVPPYPDPALPGLTVTKRLHADHIVSMDTITRMEGFDQLSRQQQLQVLNNPQNFIGLSETANTSKGSKSFTDWRRYEKGGIDVDSAFRQKMIQEETLLQSVLQQQIDNFLK